jgi:hypothetical protein
MTGAIRGRAGRGGVMRGRWEGARLRALAASQWLSCPGNLQRT